MSADTLRRWERAGKLKTRETAATVGAYPAGDRASGPEAARHRAGDTLSARNRFPGVVRSVEADNVMALVEIEQARTGSRPP